LIKIYAVLKNMFQAKKTVTVISDGKSL